MSKTIKALSLWQPWVSLMAVGAKMIETRHWSTNYRGLVGIHAAKRFQELERMLLDDKRFFNALALDFPASVAGATRTPAELANALPLGCIVAVGNLRHCLSTTRDDKFIPAKTKDEYHFGDYSENRFMWVFDEIWKLSSPVHTIGQRRLWTLDEDTRDVVIEMLPEEVRAREFGE